MYRTVIKPSNNKLSLNLKELFHYKDLFMMLAWRDFRVRYAQTLLGFLWAFLQPVFTLAILIVVFGKVVNINTGGIPYPLYAVCGMSGWTYFSYVMSQSGTSIIGAQQMVKKIYFPRLIIPLSKAIVGFIDFGITLVIIVLMMVYYSFVPIASVIYFPVFVILTILAALGVGIWLSALTIRFRDFQHILPFMVQLGLYATPVAYPAERVISNLPQWASFIYYLNPMAGIVEGFRWSLVGGDAVSTYAMISYTATVVLFISGLYYFRRTEKLIADIV